MVHFANEPVCPNCGRDPDVIDLFGLTRRPPGLRRSQVGVWCKCVNCGHWVKPEMRRERTIKRAPVLDSAGRVASIAPNAEGIP